MSHANKLLNLCLWINGKNPPKYPQPASRIREFFFKFLLISFFLNSGFSKISLRYTFSLKEFGNSIPIVLLPGIVEIRADSELVFLAISSERLTILETLIPAAGSNSLRVTTGPWSCSNS